MDAIIRFGTLALIMEALWLRVFLLMRTGDSLVEVITLILGLHVVYLIAVFLTLRSKGLNAFRGYILAAAIAFRIPFAFVTPSFSNDLWRYRWEGEIQTAGRNPYATRPADLGDNDVPSRDFRSVYGPLTLLGERLAYSVGGGRLLAMKLPALVADLTLMILLARLAPARFLIYAWSPLPILEFWSEGHNDALVALPLVLAITQRSAGVWLGVAAAVKWWPLLLLPVLGRRLRDWGSALLIPAVLMVPFLAGLEWSQLRFASGFLGGWRNNDSLFGLLLAVVGDPVRAKYVAVALIGLVAVAGRAIPGSTIRRSLVVIVALLAFSANVHPWYLTWLLPLLIWEPHPALFLWMALMPLAYESAIWWSVAGVWQQSAEVRWWIYAPVAAVAVVSLVGREIAKLR